MPHSGSMILGTGLEMSKPTAESRWGLGSVSVYTISLFTFESSIALSLITINL